jgi:hypothetical protein
MPTATEQPCWNALWATVAAGATPKGKRHDALPHGEHTIETIAEHRKANGLNETATGLLFGTIRADARRSRDRSHYPSMWRALAHGPALWAYGCGRQPPAHSDLKRSTGRGRGRPWPTGPTRNATPAAAAGSSKSEAADTAMIFRASAQPVRLQADRVDYQASACSSSSPRAIALIVPRDRSSYTGRELSLKVGDGKNRKGGISWGCLTTPLLH